MDPGAVLLGAPRLGEPRRRAARSSSSTTRPSGRTPSPGPGAARPSCGSRARPRRSSPRPTATRRVGALDPWLGAALTRRRGDAQRLDHRRAAARRDELPQLRRPDAARGVLAADRGRPRARRRVPGARPARHRRQRLALQRVADRRRSPRPPEIGVVGLLDDVATLVGPAFAASGDTIVLVGESTPGLAGSAYAALAGAAAEDGPPALDLAREAALQAFIREAIARGLVASRPGRLGRRARRRPRRVRDVGRSRRDASASPIGHVARRRPVRREPVAARR